MALRCVPPELQNGASFLVVCAVLCIAGCDVGVQTVSAPLPVPASVPTVQPQTAPAIAPTAGSNSTEPKNAEGDWVAFEAVLAGSPFPKDVTDSITLSIQGDEYQVEVGGKPDKGACETDVSTTPYRMTIRGVEGPNAGKTLLAIFGFTDEGALRVCYDLSGTEFPKTFESTAENKQFLVVYKRKP